MMARTPLRKRIQELTGLAGLRKQEYPQTVIAICRRQFQYGKSLYAISQMTGISENLIRKWATEHPHDIWTRKVEMQTCLKLPESTADRLVLAAELLWLARRRR